MRRLISLLAGAVLLIGCNSFVYASDWDIVGKVLTGIEGVRILTAGKVDIIAGVTGIGEQGRAGPYNKDSRYAASRYRAYPGRIRAPRYTWKKKWIPRHRAYDEKLGQIIVEGHYVRYKVEAGGYWQDVTKSRKPSRRHW